MKRFISMVLAICILAVIVPMPTAAAVFAEGKCGPDAYWQLNDSGVLTIYGTGEIRKGQSVYFPPWKEYKGKITSVVIKSGITSIGDEAFSGCTQITSVTLPSSLKSIGKNVFYRCSSLSEIVLPSKLESLGEYAFAQSGIQSIQVPETITTVSDYLFKDCHKLTTVTFQGPITDIGLSAFYNCDLLETVSFEKSYSGRIKDHAFAYCEALKEIEIPEGVTAIESHAFCDCESLTAVTLPEGLKSLWDSAFRGTGLVSVTIPESVTYLESGVFVFCDNLKNATLYTQAVESLNGVFAGGTAMDYVHIIGDAPKTDKALFGSNNEYFVIYYDEGTSGWVPPTWNGNLIEIWGKEDTSKTGTCGENLTWLLKDGVLTISGTGTMNDYTTVSGTAPWYLYKAWIHSIVIEDGVGSIGNYAFHDLQKVESVKISGSVKSIGRDAFWNCKKLNQVDIPDGVVSIGDHAFWQCDALTSVTIADSVVTFGSNIFAGCTSLTDVTLPQTMTKIPEYIFQGCGKLSSIDLPDGVTEIGRGAFAGCYSLTALEIPAGVEIIWDSVFQNSGLEEITIPSSVTSLGTNAFYSCDSLKTVIFLGDAPTFGTYVFRDVTATCIYPANNGTWTLDVRQDYGGTILWITDDHVHTYEKIYLAPTCTEQGYHGQQCSVCGHKYVEEYVAALGHDMAPATCTQPSTCRRENCGYQEGNTASHIWEDPCLTTRTCTVCGTTDNNGGHNWDSPNNTKRYCYACGKVEGGYLLDISDIPGEVWLDGVNRGSGYYQGFRYMILDNVDAKTLVTYTYANTINIDRHLHYPTGMKVWTLKLEGDRYTYTYVAEFENLLQYSGSSIRISGKKGIRMITSVEKAKKEALTGDGLAGYKLVEYGTALCWAKDLDNAQPMTLGQDYVKSNYAYKRGVADPVFAQTDELVQYTNVLVGFNLNQCKDDIAMRPYIILEDDKGQQITIYGGIVYRSIGYIAYQNRSVFQPGTASYQYVWEIIHAVYGAKYDGEYKG